MNKKNNKKSTFTKIQLSNTLIDLLDKFNYKDITVYQLCQYSNIARASFYRNFRSMDDVLSFYIKQIIENKIPDQQSGKRMFFKSDESISVWYDEKDLLLKLYKNNLYYLFTNQLNNTIDEAFTLRIADKDDPYYDYLAAEMAFIISSIFYKWTERNFKENKEELSQLLERLYLSRVKRELLTN